MDNNILRKYSDDDITDVEDYVSSMISDRNLLGLFRLLSSAKAGIEWWKKYLNDREFDDIDEEYEDYEDEVMGRTLKATFSSKTEKLDDDLEEEYEHEANEMKKYWEIINYSSSIIDDIEDCIKSLEYDPNYEPSRRSILLSLIKIINTIPPEPYSLDASDYELTPEELDEIELEKRWSSVKSAVANLISKLSYEDYELLYHSISARSFFRDSAYFQASKDQINRMNDAQFANFLINTEDGLDGNNLPISEIDVSQSDELDTTIAQVKKRRIQESTSPLLKKIAKNYFYYADSCITEQDFAKFSKQRKINHILDFRDKLVNDSTYAYFNDADRNMSKSEENLTNSEGFKLYTQTLKDMSDLDFIKLLTSDKYGIVTFYGNEEEIYKDKLENLSDSDFELILNHFKTIYFKPLNEIAIKRGYIKINENNRMTYKESTNSSSESSKATLALLHKFGDLKRIPNMHVSLDIDKIYDDVLKENCVDEEDFDIEDYYDNYSTEITDKIKDEYNKQQNITIENVSLLKALSYIESLDNVTFTCLVEKYSQLYNQSKDENMYSDSSAKENHKINRDYLFNYMKKRITELPNKFIPFLNNININYPNSVFGDAINLKLEHTPDYSKESKTSTTVEDIDL